VEKKKELRELSKVFMIHDNKRLRARGVKG
jgi:hypothetical protein